MSLHAARPRTLRTPADIVNTDYLSFVLHIFTILLGLLVLVFYIRRTVYTFIGKLIGTVYTALSLGLADGVLLNIAALVGLGHLGTLIKSSSQLVQILTLVPLGIFCLPQDFRAESAPTYDAAVVEELVALLRHAESETREYRQRSDRYKGRHQELIVTVDSLRAKIAGHVEFVGHLSYALKASSEMLDQSTQVLAQKDKALGKKDLAIVDLEQVVEGLKTDLAVVRSLAANKEAEMEAIKASRDKARAAQRKAEDVLKAVNVRIHQLERMVAAQQVSLDAASVKDTKQASTIAEQKDQLAAQQVVIQGLEASRRECSVHSATQGKTIEELVAKVKTLEAQTSVKSNDTQHSLAKQATTAQYTSVQLQSQFTTAPSTTSSPFLAPPSQLGAELDAARQKIIDLKCEVARCTEINFELMDELQARTADWMAHEQELLSRERTMQDEISRLRLLVQQASLPTVTSTSSVPPRAVENTGISRSKSRSSGKKARKHAFEVNEDEVNTAPRSLSPTSGQSASSGSAMSIPLPTAVADDVFYSSLTAKPSAPRVPSANSIKSGMAFASDSLPSVIISSSSKLLSNVVLDLPPATPLSSLRKPERRCTEPASPSLPEIVVSSSAELLCRRDLDLLPASPWDAPARPGSRCEQLESSINMVGSSSSQLLCRLVLDLPPVSPLSTHVRTGRHLEASSPTNLAVSSSSQLLCRMTLDSLPSMTLSP
ncbi:hypothetical protein C8T65DRAFT_833814 [Cerioporus squamosus]|nr:hypothetical protein C8T65DRAFT_833814 [Cerioporus squamosus]